MYASSDCFETFPLPRDWEENAALDAAGKMYYEHRTKLMIDNDEGMTKTYNRFHDIYETDPRIVVLRELHATMDRAVLDVYGWTDIRTDCDFIRDYEIVEAAWGPQEEVLPLPFARPRTRRSARLPPRPQRRPRRRGKSCRVCAASAEAEARTGTASASRTPPRHHGRGAGSPRCNIR